MRTPHCGLRELMKVSNDISSQYAANYYLINLNFKKNDISKIDDLNSILIYNVHIVLLSII